MTLLYHFQTNKKTSYKTYFLELLTDLGYNLIIDIYYVFKYTLNMNKKILALIIVLFFIVILGVIYNSETIRWKLSRSQIYVVGGSCTCPSDSENRIPKCLYKNKGDEIEDILKSQKESDCSEFGCSFETAYKYCDFNEMF